VISHTPIPVAARYARNAMRKASLSLTRPLMMAWLARGDVIESTPFRTS
jgi:hypothetical protein